MTCHYMTSIQMSIDSEKSVSVYNADSILVYLFLQNNPSLTKVCVWIMPFPPSTLIMNIANCPNVYFTTDCSK